MPRDDRDRTLGSPPNDWKTASDAVPADAAETRRMRRPVSLGGPPREFGSDERPALPARGPVTALVVSDDRGVAARVALGLAEAHLGIRLALTIEDADALVDGVDVVVVLVPSTHHPTASRLNWWREGRRLVALVPGREVADHLRARADAVVEPPWTIAPVLASLLGGSACLSPARADP